MSNVLLLTGGHESPAEILPSLTLLPARGPGRARRRRARSRPSPPPDAVLVDARRDLVAAKRLLQALRGAEVKVPVLVIVTEGGWAALAADWGADDVVLHTAGPARSRRGCGWPRAGPPGRFPSSPARSARASWSSTRPPTRPG